MKHYKLLKFSLFALFLQSMFIWVTWSLPLGLCYILVLLVLYNFLKGNHIKITNRHKGISLLLTIVLFYQCLRQGGAFSTWLSTALLILIFHLVINLPRQVYGDTIRFITKWMAIILVPSLVVHLFVMLTGVQSPLTLTQYDDSYGIFQNYLVYVHLTSEIVFRFNGPFLEPGHLGMITSFLLIANNFELRKWHVAFLFVCNLLTFSLAGYILTMAGWLLLYSLKMKKLPIVIFLIAVISVGVSYIPKDSMVNELLFNRLQMEDGGLSGDNRITADGDYYYNQLLKSDDWLFGYGNNLRDDRVKGSGFKIYVLRNGFIGATLWVLILLFLALKSPNKKYAILFFVVCCLSLYQRFYPYWFSWFFTYYAAINMSPYVPHILKKQKDNEY